jgi:lantibiotic leader peptide-processing serine protease
MRRIRFIAGASLGAAALVATSLTAAASPAAPARSTSTDRAAQPQGNGEYVVSYQGDAAAVTAAVTAAGGQVVDVNEHLRIALVTSSNQDFIADAQATAAVTGAARNHSVGTSRPGQPHRFAEERPTVADRTAAARQGAARPKSGKAARGAEPLADRQWDMRMMGTDAAHRRATGKGVTVGIIDTGIDASHPDLAPHFNARLSRNFTMDIPSIDGPCEVPTCIDPANVDEGGHGSHVAGIVGAARNGIGTEGVAPDATLVNVRAGQDSGFFFLFETVAALTYAGDAGLDVVNMSFFTDPWLYNCDSLDDYVAGPVTPEQLAEQAFVRQTVTAGLEYAHDRGVTMVAALGNSHANYATPTRFDNISPDFPLGTEVERTVTNDCLDMPTEGPHVISVSAVGPSTTKADYSNYGLGSADVAAPGGWFRDFVGTPQFSTPGNLVLAPYPLHVAQTDDPPLADENGNPVDDFSVVSCDRRGNNCGFYTYLQGTSMASPHVAGLAALVIEEHGHRQGRSGYSLDPDTVASIIENTATDHACPAGGVEIYTDEGRPAEFNSICEGTTDDNGLYGEGIVNAAAAVARR